MQLSKLVITFFTESFATKARCLVGNALILLAKMRDIEVNITKPLMFVTKEVNV